MGCVYLVTNRINGKQYVGQAVDLVRRKNGHRKSGLSGSFLPFHCAIRKYGFDAFNWSVLYHREMLSKEKDKEVMDRWERYYIKELSTMVPNGYNLTAGGEGSIDFTHSEVTKHKLSKLHLGIKTGPKSMIARLHISESLRGRTLSAEHRANLWKNRHKKRVRLTSKMGSPEWKRKISLALTGRKRPPFSIEWRTRLSIASRGRKHTPEARRKIRLAKCGQRWKQRVVRTQEHKDKIAAAHRGMKRSEESRKRMSDAQKLIWVKKRTALVEGGVKLLEGD